LTVASSFTFILHFAFLFLKFVIICDFISIKIL
jgi:hypothetical protein